MIHTTQSWQIGDCLELLPSIETGSIDMVLCDLPYSITACAWDTIIPFEPLWKEWKRIVKDNAAIVLTASQPFTAMLVMSNLEMFKYCWVWEKDKSKCTNFMHAKNSPLKSHEDICVFSNGAIAHSSNKNRMAYNPQNVIKYNKKVKGDVKGGKNNEHGMDRPSHKQTYNREYTNFPTSIINFRTDFKQSHPTQKPVALFEYLIRTYSNEGDTVHDSCLGSGTTLEACRRTNRNCIGFELLPDWEHLYADRCLKNTPTLQSYF